MLLRIHLPSSSVLPGGSPLQQRRLRQVITQSLERAVARLGLSYGQVELVDAEEPVQADPVRLESYPETAVLQQEDGRQIYAGGRPYVEAETLEQALRWGAALFARSGYAVLHAEGGRFSVVRLAARVRAGNAGDSTAGRVTGGTLLAPGNAGRLLAPAIALVDGSGQVYFSQQAARTPLNLSLARGIAGYDRQWMLDFIVELDCAIFAEMPWEKRYEYLLLLLEAWTTEREGQALQAILASTRTQAELAALFALLLEYGKRSLFAKQLDQAGYTLLQALADFVLEQPIDWHFLIELLLEKDLLAGSWQTLLEAASELYPWLLAVLDAAPWADSRQRRQIVLRHKEHLAELLWLVEQARQGDHTFQILLTQMLAQAGPERLQALWGLHYAEELLPAYTLDGLRRQLHGLLIFDLLTWLLDLDELQQVPQSLADLSQRQPTRMQALNARPDREPIDSHLIARLQTRIGTSEGVTAQMRKGLQTLLTSTAWDSTLLVELIEAIPTDQQPAFWQTMLFVSPAHLERWEVAIARELARRPLALAFIREAGYDLFSIAFRLTGNSWEALEIFLQKLALKRVQIGNPVEYQWFLRRLELGGATALAEIDRLDLQPDRQGEESDGNAQ